MVKAITIFRDQCKKKLFIGTYCIGVELNQFFPKFIDVPIGERVEKRYKNPHDFIVSAHHFSSTNAFSKQTLNYGRRAEIDFKYNEAYIQGYDDWDESFKIRNPLGCLLPTLFIVMVILTLYLIVHVVIKG